MFFSGIEVVWKLLIITVLLELLKAESFSNKFENFSADGKLRTLQHQNLPDLLTDRCALLGIPPYPSDSNYKDILHSLSEIFKEENSVLIAELSDSDKIQWTEETSHLAFYARQPKDRSCLLSPKITKYNAVPYLGQLHTGILTQYINEQCQVFRNSDGSLNNEGLYLEHLMSNLFVPDDQVSFCDELTHKPSKEDFFTNFLLRSRPVVIKNAYKNSTPYKNWSQDHLLKLYSNKTIHIKLTSDGIFEGVDSVTNWSEHREDYIPAAVKAQLLFPDLVIVRPATSEMLFSDFMDFISAENRSYSAYLEYSSIPQYMPELEPEVEQLEFAEGLERRHLNMWLSDGNTLGKLHFDPYDNLLVQLSGEKHLTLFDPHHNENLYEAHIPEAKLSFHTSNQSFSRDHLLESTSMVMSPVDIASPDLDRFPLFSRAKRLHCVIRPGDVLFMPAFWWHEVQSYPDKQERRNLAINFWYDPVYSKEFPCQECRLKFNMNYKHFLTGLL